MYSEHRLSTQKDSPEILTSSILGKVAGVDEPTATEFPQEETMLDPQWEDVSCGYLGYRITFPDTDLGEIDKRIFLTGCDKQPYGQSPISRRIEYLDFDDGEAQQAIVYGFDNYRPDKIMEHGAEALIGSDKDNESSEDSLRIARDIVARKIAEEIAENRKTEDQGGGAENSSSPTPDHVRDNKPDKVTDISEYREQKQTNDSERIIGSVAVTGGS